MWIQFVEVCFDNRHFILGEESGRRERVALDEVTVVVAATMVEEIGGGEECKEEER